MTRFVPLKFKHLPVSDHIPSRIAKHIKHRVYQSQFEYINKKDFPARNPNCNFKLMEASLFNSAKILKMELSQRAFFINLQVPHSMISSEELTGQQLEVISSKIRMIRINTKSRVPVALQDIDEEIYLEFCIYDVENFYPSTFSQIQRFKMRYTQTGDLEQYATTEQEPCIDFFLFLNLNGLKQIPSNLRDKVYDQVLLEMKRELKETFSEDVRKLLFKSGMRLNGPIMYNSVIQVLKPEFCSKASVSPSHQKYSEYYATLIGSLQEQQVRAPFIAQVVSEAYPDAIRIAGDSQQFLLINDSQTSKYIYLFREEHLQEIYVFSSAECGSKTAHCQEKFEESLSKAFKILMSAFWNHASLLQ